MKKTIGILLISIFAFCSPLECPAQEKLSKKEMKQLKERQEKDEILEIIESRNFTLNIQSVIQYVTGAVFDLTKVSRQPEVLFRPNGIRIFVPYYTGNTPEDGVMGNESLGHASHRGFDSSATAPIYPHTWLDWSFAYPSDVKITEDRHTVKMTFTTDMGTTDTYLCEFIFSRKNVEFFIDCKSYAKTQYRGHLTKFE